MRFCLQCGAVAVSPISEASRTPAAVAPVHPAAQEDFVPPKPPINQFRQPRTPASTVNLKIAPTPVMEPRFTPINPNARPSLGDRAQEVDDEALKKAFEKPIRHQQGAVVCRFCKGPLFLGGEFCEHCGAPVAEAAPVGMVEAASHVSAPPVPTPEEPLVAAIEPAKVDPPTKASADPVLQTPPAPMPVKPAAPPPPRPHNPYLSAPGLPQDEQPGLMGRLKGIFKKS
jgi:hypothetical protein